MHNVKNSHLTASLKTQNTAPGPNGEGQGAVGGVYSF